MYSKQDFFFRERDETETFESLFDTRPRPSILASMRDRDRDLSRPRPKRFSRCRKRYSLLLASNCYTLCCVSFIYYAKHS